MKKLGKKKLKWEPLESWDGISKSGRSAFGNAAITKKDIERFVQMHLMYAAKDLNVPYEELEDDIKTENKEFFNSLEVLYARFSGMSEHNIHMQSLKSLFKVPRLDLDNTEKVIQSYMNLSDEEKAYVLSVISN